MTVDENSMKVIKWGAIIAGGIAAILIGRKIIQNVQSGMSQRAAQNALEDTVGKMKQKQSATISESEALTLANNLYNAMESTGTDTNAIESITRKLKNGTDWALVASKFGSKPYGTTGSPLYSWFPSVDTDLYGWLRNECSGSMIAELEKKWDEYGIIA